MKSLIGLWQVLADELASWCGTTAHRDVDTLRRRVEHEGMSFLTITLPSFGSAFERALELGGWTSDLDTSFSCSGGLPKFLSGFLRLVFNPATGVLLDSPSTDAIFAIRQLTAVFKKIELQCTPEREQAAVDGYVRTDEEIVPVDANLRFGFSRMASLLFGEVFSSLERRINDYNLEPRHGPGATADRKVGNAKFVQLTWTDRLEEYFPYGEYVLPNWRYAPELEHVQWLSPEQELPVKVTLVPKTLRTPRVIAIEPTCMQYMQQGLMAGLVPLLEGQFPGSSYIGFTDQSLNREMAQLGSIDGSLATLDLSEASDRVSVEHVEWLLRGHSDLRGAIMACRSTHAKLPSGEIIPLKKFASMGSALCFPIEAMVFLTIVFLGIEGSEGRPLTKHGIQSLHGRVRVYGDDIIVPVEHVQSVINTLEAFGLKVNASKSFWSGKFRESCGGDFFDGEDVTPIRLKKSVPDRRRVAEECIAFSEFGNALHKRGLWKTASYVRNHMEKVLGLYPCVPDSSSAVGAFSFVGCEPDGWDSSTQRPKVKAFVPVTKEHEHQLDEHWALRKTLASDWSDPVFREHLLQSGRGLPVRIKRGWVYA